MVDLVSSVSLGIGAMCWVVLVVWGPTSPTAKGLREVGCVLLMVALVLSLIVMAPTPATLERCVRLQEPHRVDCTTTVIESTAPSWER